MATENYDDFADTAREMLTESGNRCVLYHKEGGTIKEYSGIGAKFDYESEAIGSNNNIIKSGDCRFLCQFSVQPAETVDTIKFGTVIYNVVRVGEISPDNEHVVIYKVVMRKR